MGKRLTHEEFIERFINKNTRGIQIRGVYQNSTTPILAYCTKHDFEWSPTPMSLLQNNGCTLCRKEYGKLQKEKCRQEFRTKASTANPNIEILSEYVDSQTRIECKCKTCGYIWNSLPSNILAGYACVMCSGNKKKTTEEYQKCINEIFPDVIVIDEYKTAHIPILHSCKICGYKWRTKPTHILSGHGCSRCQNRERKNHEQYVEMLLNSTSMIEVIEPYVGMLVKTQHRCLVCGHIWSPKPANIIHLHQGCPVCKMSHGEKQIMEYLIKNHISFDPQHTFDDCRVERELPFDFYLPDLNVCIEYDGEQHFRPIDFFGGKEEFAKRQFRDNVKTQYCADNHIVLLRISYYDNITNILNNFFTQ